MVVIRLEEVHFDAMGSNRNQRILPYLMAANTVNYGKPFKLNTAEALAACLYISGFKEDAMKVMSSFSYGAEFIRMNLEALDAYSACKSALEVERLHFEYIEMVESRKAAKELKKQALSDKHTARKGHNIGGYMDDMDLPPSLDDEDIYGEDDNNEEDNTVDFDGTRKAETKVNSTVVDATLLANENSMEGLKKSAIEEGPVSGSSTVEAAPLSVFHKLEEPSC